MVFDSIAIKCELRENLIRSQWHEHIYTWNTFLRTKATVHNVLLHMRNHTSHTIGKSVCLFFFLLHARMSERTNEQTNEKNVGISMCMLSVFMCLMNLCSVLTSLYN